MMDAPMRGHQDINIEVTISQELRDLVARVRMGGPEPMAEPLPVQPNIDAGIEILSDQCDAPVHDQICVRRDGQRPARFPGLAMLSFSGALDVGGWDCVQDVTLYRSDEDRFFLALALEGPETMPARPVYDCLEIGPGSAPDPLRQWFSRLCKQIPFRHRTGAPSYHLSVIANGFHALTAHCFRAQPMPAERNEICLQ